MYDKFASIFAGLDRTFGRWGKPPKTIKKRVTSHEWKMHLDGKVGLGIVPIDSNNRCRWAALDIDIDDIDHLDLLRRIELMKLPLAVCRSKSGAAHCYTFFEKPRSAKVVRKLMSAYASKLGYGGCEIFPKQDLLRIGQHGNWINLPYFNARKSERYAFIDGKPANIDEFFLLIESIKTANASKDGVVGKDPEHGGMPPCLINILGAGKITKGSGVRNNCLYNFGVFYKRKYPDNWEDLVTKANYNIFEKPLPVREVQALIKSLDLKSYNYRCEEKPINSLCDRLECITREFGVKGHTHSYENMTIGSLSKIMTDPPRWCLEINGVDLIIATVDIMNYMRIRVLCMENVDIIAPPMKQEDWLQIIKNKMADKTEIDAPDDTGFIGQVKPIFTEFLSIARRNRDKDDIERGIPAYHVVKEKSVIIFRSNDFIAYAKRNRVEINVGPELWISLRSIGCDHCKVKINKKSVQVWYIEKNAIDLPIISPINEEPEI